MTYPRDCQRPQDPRSYELYWCGTCKFGQLQPRPLQAEVDGYYLNYYTHTPVEDRTNATGMRTLMERVRVRLAWSVDHGADLDADLVDQLVDNRPSSICDLGCGDGQLLAALRDRGHRVVGLEPDPLTRRLALARGLTVHEGHADDLPEAIASGRFDVVILCHVLHLCLDPARVIRNARRLLRQGGLLVCETTNNEASGLRQLGACWRWLDMPRHLDLFTATSLEKVVADAGLRIRRVDFTGYTRQFKGAWLNEEAAKRATLYPSRLRSRAWQTLRNWLLLVRTAVARPERKYDSVRVVAEATGG